MKLIFILKLLLFSSLVLANACLDQAIDGYKLQDVYHAVNDKNPISFSYEIEYSLKENPNLVDYYRVKGISDEDWLKLPKDERLKRALKAHQKTSSQNSVVLEKLQTAPDFLSPTMVKESNTNLEMITNPITTKLEEVYQNLDWIWENIGPGSIQGHTAFNRKGVELENVIGLVKSDYDISQAESLVKGYEAHISRGSQAGANLSHHSLGPVDNETIKVLEKNLGKPGKLKNKWGYSRETKFIYGLAYRPDLYGRNKVGFEIRNCHKRLQCIKDKLKLLSEDLQVGLDSFKHLADAPTINKEMLEDIPDSVRDVYSRAEKVNRKKNASYVTGSDYANRYLYPHLNWKEHPLITALPLKDQKEFHLKLEKANEAYNNEIVNIGKWKNTNLFPPKIQNATAKWAHSIGLDEYLKAGMKVHRNAKQVSDITQNLVNKGIPKEVINALSAAGMTEEQAKKIENAIGLMGDSKLTLDEVFKFVQDFEKSKNFLKLIDELDPKTISEFLGHKQNKIKFLENFVKFNESERKTLGITFRKTGLRTTLDSPDGSWVFKKIISTEPETMKAILEYIKLADDNIKLDVLLKARSVDYFPKEIVKDSNDLGIILEIMTGNKSVDNFKWMRDYLESVKLEKTDADKSRNFYQVLMLEASTSIEPLSKREFLVNYEGISLVAKLKRGNSKPFSFKNKEDYGADKVDKLVAKRLEEYARIGVKVSDLELLNIIRSKPDGVFVISATAIHHQGLVIGDTVYSVVDKSGVSRLPVENWISNWGSSTLVELKTTKEQKINLLNSIEAEVGKKVNFAIKAHKGDINCTNMVSCHLENNDLYEFPNSYTRADSKGQIQHLVKEANKGNDKIKAVYIRKDRLVERIHVAKALLYSWGAGYLWLVINSVLED